MTKSLSSFAPGILAKSTAAQVSLAPPTGRLSLRAKGNLAPLNAALCLTLPLQVGQRIAVGGVEAICLGPDEWTLHASDVGPTVAACAEIYADHPHSLTDISGREITFLIEGPRAAELLTLGCARDIESIAVGEGRRTVCDGASVILWRDGPDTFRMDVWHSFAPHLLHLFETGCRELAAEAV